jgi:hypothetical protein
VQNRGNDERFVLRRVTKLPVVHPNDSSDVNVGINEQQDIVKPNGVGGELELAPKKSSTAMTYYGLWSFL